MLPQTRRGCRLEAYMCRLAITICLVLITAPCYAQIGAKELTLAGVSDCIKDAIGTGSVENNGPVVIFFCSAAKARILYNFLGAKVHADVVQDSNGKFENRQFGNNACYHRIEDPSGKAADDFRCDLLLTIGDALNDQSTAK
jgi:hypothetical protein